MSAPPASAPSLSQDATSTSAAVPRSPPRVPQTRHRPVRSASIHRPVPPSPPPSAASPCRRVDPEYRDDVRCDLPDGYVASRDERLSASTASRTPEGFNRRSSLPFSLRGMEHMVRKQSGNHQRSRGRGDESGRAHDALDDNAPQVSRFRSAHGDCDRAGMAAAGPTGSRALTLPRSSLCGIGPP